MHSCASQPGKTSISCRVFPLSCSLAVYYLSACSTTFLCSVFHQQLPYFFPSVFEHQLSQPAFFTQSSFDLFFRQVDFYRKFGVWAWMLARSFFSLDRFCLTVFSCLFFFYKILWYWSKSMLEAIEIPVSWSPFFNIGRGSLLSWNKFTEEQCESLLKSQNSSFVWLPLLAAHGCSDIFLSSPKSN